MLSDDHRVMNYANNSLTVLIFVAESEIKTSHMFHSSTMDTYLPLKKKNPQCLQYAVQHQEGNKKSLARTINFLRK